MCVGDWSSDMCSSDLSRVRLLATPWSAAYQAPPPMGFSRQEYWRGSPLPSPGLGNIKSPLAMVSKLLLWKMATRWQHFSCPIFFSFFFLCNFILILYWNRIDFQSCVCIRCTGVAETILEKSSTTLGELENSGLLRWRAQRS